VGFAIPAPDADKDYSDFALPQENLPAIDDVAASDYSLQAGIPLFKVSFYSI